MLPLIAVAAAIALMAGLNLPLAAFLISVAVRLDLSGFAQEFPSLAPLGSIYFLAAAAALAVVEFIIDRIPRLDSLWDIVGMIIRPAGACALVFFLFLPTHAIASVAGFLAAIIALAVHLSKAALRVRINRAGGVSKNVFVSNAEDALVIGIAALATYFPLLSFTLTIPLITLALYLVPKSARSLRQNKTAPPDPTPSDS